MKLLYALFFALLLSVPAVGLAETAKPDAGTAKPADTKAKPEVINGIAAVVNDEPITLLEVNREVALMTREAERKSPLSAAAKQQLPGAALNRLIDKALIDQKIRELNIKVPEEEVRQSIDEIKKQNNLSQEALVAALTAQGLTFDQYRAQFREQLERLRLMSQEVRSKIQVGQKEIADYYAANPAKYGGEEFYRARQIFFKLVKDPPANEVKRVMAVAMDVLNQARSGKDFVELAKKYSDDPRAKTDGGDLGAFRKGDMLPEIEDTVAKMKIGSVSDLVITPAGFHIIKLEQRYMGSVKPLDDVKGEIEETLYKKKSEERFSQWLEELRKSAAIDIK